MSSAPPSSAADPTAATEATDASPAQLPASHPPLAPHDLPLAPTTIDRFQILTTLGSGGMGVVYQAYDPKLDRDVAIKLVHRRLSEREGTRLRREAQSLARLSHPNVVQVFEVGRCPHGVYLVLELVRGRTLRQWLGARTREPPEILATFLQAGEGLAAAHAAGLVHRDFKPGNVLVGDDGRARVLDFGLARVGRATDSAHDSEPGDPPSSSSMHDPQGDATLPASSSTLAAPVPADPSPLGPDSLGEDLVAARLTDHDAVLGTPAYMAPEQHLGQPLTAAADQFGFCVALYEALYRTHPFGAPEDRIQGVLLGAVRPPPPSTTLAVPEHVRTAILRGLSLEPGDRFPSMPALLRALRPPPRRPWLALGAGLVAATTLTAAALVWTPTPDPCTAGPVRLAAAWDDQRDAARNGMLATGLPYAAATWDRTEARLRAYGDAWLSAYAHTCAAGVRGSLAPAELDGRMRCLDEGRQAVGALVGALANADAGAVQHAIEAVGQLPRVEHCDDPEYLRGAVALPPAAIAADVEALREQLATLRVLYITGHHVRGLALAAELRPRVTALGYAPLLAELELREGMLEIRAVDPAKAHAHLEAAYFLAKELGHDRVTLEAAMNLVYVTSSFQHDAAAAKTWLDHTAAELPRSGVPSQRAGYEALRGVVASQAQRHEEAVAHYTRALELQTAVAGSEDDPAVARSLSNLGGALAWLGRFDEAIAALRRASEITERQLGPLHPDLARHLNNLGIILHNQADPSAREQLERALTIREQTLEPDHLDIANTLEELGHVHMEAERLPDAQRVLERALAIRTRKQGPEHLQLALTLVTLGELQLAQDTAPTAERSFRRALEMTESVAPGHPLASHAQVWLGLALLEQRRWDEATAALRLSLTQLEAMRGPEHIDLMRPLLGLAQAALAQGHAADALAPAERALTVGERSELPPTRVADARWLVAQALVDTGGDRSRARALVEQAAAAWQDAPGKTEELADARRWLATHPR